MNDRNNKAVTGSDICSPKLSLTKHTAISLKVLGMSVNVMIFMQYTPSCSTCLVNQVFKNLVHKYPLSYDVDKVFKQRGITLLNGQ